MRILAIETSDKTADIALLDTEHDQVWKKELKTVQKVSETLVDEIKELFQSVEYADLRTLRITDIDLVAVGIGPGSYTGTRVGIATAKGLAQGLKVKMIGVTSFEALIEAIDEDYEDTEIIPLIDAKNDRVYFQIGEEQGCSDISEVLERLKDKNYVFVGTGATTHRGLIAERFQEQAKVDDRDQVSAKFIAQIAQGRAEANLHDNAIALKPLYINKPNIGTKK